MITTNNQKYLLLNYQNNTKARVEKIVLFTSIIIMTMMMIIKQLTAGCKKIKEKKTIQLSVINWGCPP